MAINENSAFVRVVFDLKTPVAIAFDKVVKESGKTKKKFLEDLITESVANATKRKK
jgi:hypothetical protein